MQFDKSGKTATASTDGRANRARYARVTYTPKEDKLLKDLRVGQRLSWDEVYKRFNESFQSDLAQAYRCVSLRS